MAAIALFSPGANPEFIWLYKLYPYGYSRIVKITFAAATSGRSYFEKFIESLSVHDRAVILAVFQDIEDYGFDARGCGFKQIEGKLWEIKRSEERRVGKECRL